MSNPRADRVKAVAKLSGRSARSRTGLFLVEGPQAVREALKRDSDRPAAGRIVTEVYATSACIQREPELELLLDAVPWRTATEDVLSAMADTEHPQGVLAVSRRIDVPLQTVLDSRPTLLAVMCRIQDPGNAGTILRAADSAGADAVVVTSGSVDIYNPKAVRSTAGSLFHLPVVVGQDFGELMLAAQEADLTVLAADGYGSEDLDVLQDASARRRLLAHSADAAAGPAGAAAGPGGTQMPPKDPAMTRQTARPALEVPTLWLFGNEANGLNSEELDAATFRVAVPLYGQAESLNVGTAATVCLYASARAQRD